MKKAGLTILLIFSCFFLFAQDKNVVKGMKVVKSTKFRKGLYKLDAKDNLRDPVVVVEGSNITVDFNGAILQGSNLKKNPDEFFGLAVLVRNGKNVTIKNLKAKGYKVAIMATGVENLRLENCDLSYNYRQHLNSTQEKEDISDWMSYHHNEKDEWLRYGAAIYLKDCANATVTACTVTGGQNGLMMTRCDSGFVYDNDFSFNSGIGLGVYRCNKKTIAFNKINFNIRGYSHGVYNRGQDSGGILVFEQCSNNVFQKNSATHGGDGFFLWAGQTTMDDGSGGCNDNLVLENDFSYAATNGIEVTFSRNHISGNRIFECDHGIWGGYSYNTTIAENKFRNNRIAIAIEHGQNNSINYNLFDRDKEAIRLWANKEQPPGWGYVNNRDTRSHGYIIQSNSFNGNPVVFNLKQTDDLNIFGNTYSGYGQLFKIDSTVSNIDSAGEVELDALLETFTGKLPLNTIKKNVDPFKDNGKFAGKKNILITEWGPYDFRSPIIWNTNPVDSSGILHFDILGPKGTWRIKRSKGVDHISVQQGSIPASITAQKVKDVKTDIEIELEYKGPSVTTPFGETIAAGKSYSFSFKKFFQPVNWTVNWFYLDTASFNPLRSEGLFAPNVRVRPVKTEQVTRIDYAWWGGIKTDQGQLKQFITTAEGEAVFDKGAYEISVTWDDAVRLYVDDRLVVDEWEPSKYTFDESPNKKVRIDLEGTHHLRVEHLELGGFATLALKIVKL